MVYWKKLKIRNRVEIIINKSFKKEVVEVRRIVDKIMLIKLVLKHSHKSLYNRKKCRIYIVLPKNDSHQSVYNCVNLQVCYGNHVNLH